MKKVLISTLVLFVVWQIMDFLIHGVILMSAYAATAQLWRPQTEIMMPVLMIVCLAHAFIVSWIYANMISAKSLMTGLKFGALLGVAFGMGMGYGMYAVMPLPYSMALTWFLGTFTEMTVGGILLGVLIKE